MRISTLFLEQFRSYKKLECDFSGNDVHLLIGPNAAGKTNILEAIALLSLTKPWQGADEADVIHWGDDFYRVRAEAEADDGEGHTLEVVSQMAPRKQKACFHNDVKVSIGEMVGTLPLVFFVPQNLDLFSGPPQQRRTFLDQLLCQVSPEYLIALSHYQKILKQRNSLLRNVAEGSTRQTDLDLWDQQLAEPGAAVTLKRLELIEVLQCTLQEELQSLGEKWDEAVLQYERKSTQREQDALQKEIAELLHGARKRDIMLQSTSVGPHREDWHIDVSGHNLPTFASRGQQRTAVLALLFLQVSFLELRRNEKPVILLDDVFSELDDNHQTALLSCFEGHQVLITSTHLPSNVHGAQVWNVGDGSISAV